MDGGAAGMGGIKIDKLTETNFHQWRQRIKMVLALRDLDDMLDEDSKPTVVVEAPAHPAHVCRRHRVDKPRLRDVIAVS